MPDQNGTFLGIRVPELPWLKDEEPEPEEQEQQQGQCLRVPAS